MLKEALTQKKIMVFDGAMGTRLQEIGLPAGCPPEEWNLSHPDEVASVHRSYVDAGSDLIQTNTFGANRIRLKRAGLDDKLEEINRQAFLIAQKSKKQETLLAASVGPLGEFIQPYGDLSPAEAKTVFSEQMTILYNLGIRIFHLETFNSLEEAQIAIQVAQQLGGEVIASFSFQPRGGNVFTTLMGENPQTISQTMANQPISALGANCGTGIKEMIEIIRIYREHYPGFISCKPNAGIPQLIEGKLTYTETADDFKRGAHQLVQLRTNLIGGCCGTNQDYISAIRAAIDQEKVS
ncbi:MAG: hypothetical protein PWP04_1685 [Candidatus Atribacteria bacterium]|nr:hypothetical protein [Candidatus Atribacteria bacterium]